VCGIVGLVRWAGLAPEDPERVRRGAQALKHRGPDGDGFWQDKICALGFRRLAIIDLSPAGAQPMANEDGRLQIVFNGEIYNYRDLRKTLENAGHKFRSQSDTEVLLHGYEEWGGEALLGKLRGMFAFALWDARARKLFAARDPLGVKPFYFAERAGAMMFASEPKALFVSGLASAELDPVALHEALTYRYVPAPRSGFKDIEKLPPGYLLNADESGVDYRAWWTLPVRPAEAADRDISGHLHNAISRRLIADVPVGAWLSGGIDSGLVLAEMGTGRQSVSAGFAQTEYDERELAAASAKHLGAQHEAYELPADIFKSLPQIVWHTDEPYFDSSCLPTFELARATKRKLSVVLSGDGGDEAFAGYERYVGLRRFYPRWKRTPGLVQRMLLRYARWRHKAATRQGWDRLVRWLEKLALQEAGGVHPYLGAMTLFDPAQIRALYAPGLAEENAELDGREYLNNALHRVTKALHPATPPDAYLFDPGILQRADYETYLPGDVLHKVDRISMAHGVEVRSPFLDVDLIAAALALSDDERLPGRETKPLLRRLAAEKLPPEVVHARKRGFGVPLDAWFRGPLQKTAQELFQNSVLVKEQLFQPAFWEPYWREHQAGQAQHGERLYALLATELWYRTFILQACRSERPTELTV